MSKHVAVLMGGWSAEREVSLVSGEACAKALRERGYRITKIDVDRDLAATLIALDPRPDVAFNALHGRYGEDGCAPTPAWDPPSRPGARRRAESARSSPRRQRTAGGR